MRYGSLEEFLSSGKAVLSRGPIAVILVEDPVEVESTLMHHLGLGFRSVLAVMPGAMVLDAALEAQVHRIDHTASGNESVPAVLNPLIAAAPGTWFHYAFNAEYLFYPFCETRSVGELLAFHTEERRDAMLTYVVDLYAKDLTAHPDAVSRETAHFDAAGYYALTRKTPAPEWAELERQMDFFGGLRWRFEEHVPPERRRIDRISLFRAVEGLTINADHTTSVAEMNTFACPWHNNLTAAICSFRTAKALRTNPGSRSEIDSFMWRFSRPFEWHSQQLMDHGLMEPGQWF